MEVDTTAAPTECARLLTLDEVAEATGVTRHTIRKWIAAGEIGYVNVGSDDKYGRRFRVRPDQLTAFIEARSIASTDDDR